MKQENYQSPRNITYERCFNLILDFFNGDKDKALAWYLTSNPMLGNMTPYEMIKTGRARKLMSFIKASIAENYRQGFTK